MNKLVKRMFVAAMVLFALGIVTPIVVLSALDGSARNKAGAATLGRLGESIILQDKYSDKVKETEKKRNEARDKKNKLEAETAQLQREADEILAYLEEIDKKQSETMLELEQTQAELERVTGEYEEASAELAAAEERLATQYESMKKRIQYIYENGQMEELEMYMKSKSISDILNSSEYIKKINVYDRNLLEEYALLKDDVAERKKILEVQVDEMQIAKDMYQMDWNYCQEIINAKSEAMAKYEETIGANEALLEDYIEDLATAQKSYEQAVAEQKEYIRQQEEIRRKQEEEARRKAMEQAAKTTPVSNYDNAKDVPLSGETSLSKMIWPFPGEYYVGSKFGPRVPPCKGASSFHQGWDIGGTFGKQIVAVLAGKVTESGYNRSCGNHVYIDHGNGYSTHYLHFSQCLVKKGDYVQQGQVIGLCGSTGISTAPHLHFALYKNGSAIDPAPYLHK